MSEKFKSYKRKLRWKSTMRKIGAEGPVPGQRYRASELPPGSVVTTTGSTEYVIGRSGLAMRWEQPIPGSDAWQVVYVRQLPPGEWMTDREWSEVAGTGSQGDVREDFFNHPDPWMDNEPGSLTLPEHWGAVSGSHSPNRLSGMDDPTPDPSFDAERAAMPEQQQHDQQQIVDAIQSITPQMQQFMRTRGINEPDWEPLEHVIPPSHRGDWMWMGYGDNGQREYKHWATRRYLNLRPAEEIPQQAKFDNYDRLHLYNRPYVPHLRFHQPNGEPGPYQPVDMNYALDHAYEDTDKLIGTNGEVGTHPYPQGYPSTEWEHMEVPPWERPPYPQQEPGPSDFDPYGDQR